MGRYKDVDIFYLRQSFARTPNHFVRDNVNMLVIFRQDKINLKHILNGNTDMTFAQFKELCLKCWNNDKFVFIVIDKGSGNGRYRKNFDQFLINRSAS